MSRLRGLARETMMDHVTPAVGITLLYFLLFINVQVMIELFTFYNNIVTLVFSQIFAFALKAFFSIFTAGRICYFIGLADQRPTPVRTIFAGFKSNPGRIIGAGFLFEAIKFVFLIPGIVYSFSMQNAENQLAVFFISLGISLLGRGIAFLIMLPFMPVFYLLMEFPNMPLKKAIRMSFWLMKGNNMKLFGLFLSYLPLYITGIVSFGVGFIWISPLLQITLAYFYLDLLKQKQGSTDASE